MEKITGTFTVFFQDPFWVGVYERTADGVLTACKITFGAEPKDYDVHAFLLEHWHTLQFSPPVPACTKPQAVPNPKRMQRAIGKQLRAQGASTKSQLALQLQREEAKAAGRKAGRAQREAEKQRQFALRQQKRKEKHRGK